MAYIGKKPEDAFRGLAYYDTFTGDGSTTTFDLSADAPDGGQNDITVVVDNVRQEPGATKSYTLGDDGSGNYRRITFNVAPDNGSEIYAINPGRSTQLNTVSDNAISAAKIQTDAVTTAKIQDDAVTSAKIADGTIVSSNIAPGTIANDRLANTGITINGTSIALGASGEIVAGTDWQAVTVADGSTTLNAEAGKGYFLDTNTGVIEVFLPTSPTRGDTIILIDYAGTFATNQCIVNTGTVNLDSTTTGQYVLTTNDTIAEFVYVDAAKGWVTRINTTSGTTPSGAFTNGVYDEDTEFVVATGGTITTVNTDFKVHTFTGDGCFVVTSGFGSKAQVNYVIVGGGGSGGGSFPGGPVNGSAGGGAGGLREAKTSTNGCYTASPLATPTGLQVNPGTYPITVGGGGAASPNSRGTSGSPSVFSTITSTGGGAGGAGNSDCGLHPGLPGGSGGGGPGTAGSGNTPPTSPPQGNDGGTPRGGGGGATQAGQPNPFAGPGIGPGCGGDGASSLITGSSVAYAGGGGGGNSSCGIGGIGGGGAGGTGNGTGNPGVAGATNTGGGGGGRAYGPMCGGGAGTSGGKGIVIIRYKFQ